MTDDEEKQLKRELLAVELALRRKQEFWETPRNIAILVGVTAAIAAAIGFWLGRASTPPSAPITRPVTIGGLVIMRGESFIDTVQTAGIVVIAAVLIYVVVRLERAVKLGVEKLLGTLNEVMKQQSQFSQNLRRVWERVDLIESKPAQASDRAVLGEWVGRAWQHIEKLEARLDAMEKGEPPPDGARPTDPPLGSPREPTGE
jgi:hypothetical protein